MQPLLNDIKPTTTDTTALARCDTFAPQSRLLTLQLSWPASRFMHIRTLSEKQDGPDGQERVLDNSDHRIRITLLDCVLNLPRIRVVAQKNKLLLLSLCDSRKPGCWSLSRASYTRQVGAAGEKRRLVGFSRDQI